jgi:hypothetical protein
MKGTETGKNEFPSLPLRAWRLGVSHLCSGFLASREARQAREEGRIIFAPSSLCILAPRNGQLNFGCGGAALGLSELSAVETDRN